MVTTNMKNLAIYGAGGFGKEVASLIDRINKAYNEPQWNLIGFFDDGKPKGSQISHYGIVLGGLEDLNRWSGHLDIAVAIGNPNTISSIVKGITNNSISYPNLIDPNFKVADPKSFNIGQGNIIQGSCFASCDVTIGNFNVLNGSVVIGHDVTIGDCNVLMPAVRISGEVVIDSHNMFGINSVVLQQLRIGKHVTVGAGSVLMTRPKDEGLYIGVPAKRFKI